MNAHPEKRIRLTISWYGQCSEDNWIRVLQELIEAADASKTMRVVRTEALTAHGRTEEIDERTLAKLAKRPSRVRMLRDAALAYYRVKA